MKTTHFVVILILFSLVSFAAGYELTPIEPRWKQLNQAYGFVLGQQASLELIEKKFPDLSKDAKHSWFVFNSSALGESVKGVEAELSALLGDKWSNIREMMTSETQKIIEGQKFTRDQATAFLTEVKLRGKGELPAPILSTLLSANQRFLEYPSLELTEGWKQTFRTKDHPKAKGVDFSISFPASWSKREGDRPNIIHVFQSGAGHGPIMCNLMVKDMHFPAGYKLTQEELREFFKPDELKCMIPDAATFIEAKSIVLDGSPAGMIVLDQTKQRLDLTLTIRMTQFVTIQGNSMIFIQFAVAKISSSDNSLDELQKKYISIYRAIANTLVLNDKYK